MIRPWSPALSVSPRAFGWELVPVNRWASLPDAKEVGSSTPPNQEVREEHGVFISMSLSPQVPRPLPWPSSASPVTGATLQSL